MPSDDLHQPQSNILRAQRKTVESMFRRAGVEIKVWREVDLGLADDKYGKEEEGRALIADDVPAFIDSKGPGALPDRVEERYGERVYWEPRIYLPSSAPVLEKDVLEYPLTRYPENPNTRNQLWELETIIPYETHLEGNLQRFIEQ